MEKKTAALAAMVLMAGCASDWKNTPEQVGAKEVVAASLMQVADEIRDTQYMVANVGRAQMQIPDLGALHAPELNQSVSVYNWHGELEVLLSDLAERVGYRFMQSGKKPAIAYVVHADYKRKPVSAVLQDLQLQAGTGVAIRVDGYQRQIVLNYLKH